MTDDAGARWLERVSALPRRQQACMIEVRCGYGPGHLLLTLHPSPVRQPTAIAVWRRRSRLRAGIAAHGDPTIDLESLQHGFLTTPETVEFVALPAIAAEWLTVGRRRPACACGVSRVDAVALIDEVYAWLAARRRSSGALAPRVFLAAPT